MTPGPPPDPPAGPTMSPTSDNSEQNQQTSPSSSAQKKYRFILDLRTLNQNSCNDVDSVTFPSYDEILTKIKGEYFFSFDFSNSYYTLQVRPEDRYKLGFTWNGQKYHLNRLPQGWKYSNYYQSNAIQQVFSRSQIEKYQQQFKTNINVNDFLDRLILFSDDLIVSCDDYNQHNIYLHLVLWLISQKNFLINPQKAEYLKKVVRFNGSIINLNNKTSSICPNRLISYLSYRRPRSRAELCSRLQSLSFSSKWLMEYKKIALPLFTLLTSHTYTWTKLHDYSWTNLKMLLLLNTNLHVYNPDFPLFITSDSSLYSYSFLIAQINTDTKDIELLQTQSRLHPKPTLNRSILAKETVGLSHALNTFESYITNSKHTTTLLTDVEVLQFNSIKNSSNSTLLNFSLLLASFPSVQIISCPSRFNSFSDFFSRNYILKFHSNRRDTLPINEKFFKQIMLLNHSDILDVLFTPQAEKIDCNPKIKFDKNTFSEAKKDGFINQIFNVFQKVCFPSEYEFMRLAASKANFDHDCWAEFKMLNGKVKKTEISKLVKKYKLNDLKIKAHLFVNKIQEVQAPHLFLVTDECYQFLQEVKRILHLTHSNKDLYIQIGQFRNQTIENKLNILADCQQYLEQTFKVSFEKLTEIIRLIPIYFSGISDVEIKPGKNCLHLCPISDIKLIKNQLTTIQLNFSVFDNSRMLYLEPDFKTDNILIENVISFSNQFHFFQNIYILSKTNKTFPKNISFLKLLGFNTTFEIGSYNDFRPKTRPEQYTLSPQTQSQMRNFSIIEDFVLYSPKTQLESQSEVDMDIPYLKIKSCIPVILQQDQLPFSSLQQSSSPIVSLEKIASFTSDIYQNVEDSRLQAANNHLFLNSILKGNLSINNLIKYQLSDKRLCELIKQVQNRKISNYILNEQGLLFKLNYCSIAKKHFPLLCLPVSLSKLIINFLHHTLNNHTSAAKLRNIFQRNFHSLDTKSLIQDSLDNCFSCQFSGDFRIKNYSSSLRTFHTKQPNKVHYLDFAHSFPKCKVTGWKHLLLVVDLATSHLFCQGVTELTAQAALQAYLSILTCIGFPYIVCSDTASCFRNVFAEYLASQNIFHHKTVPQRSQSQGNVESIVNHFRSFFSRNILQDEEIRSSWGTFLAENVLRFNLQSVNNSPVSRKELYFGSDHVCNLKGSHHVYGHVDRDTKNTILDTIYQNRLNRNKKLLSTCNIQPGDFVTILSRAGEKQQIEDSKYLLPKSNMEIYLVLFRFLNSLRLKSLKDGALRNIFSHQVRKIQPAERLSTNFLSSFNSTFNQILHKPGSRHQFQPLTNSNNVLHLNEFLEQLHKPDIEDKTRPESSRREKSVAPSTHIDTLCSIATTGQTRPARKVRFSEIVNVQTFIRDRTNTRYEIEDDNFREIIHCNFLNNHTCISNCNNLKQLHQPNQLIIFQSLDLSPKEMQTLYNYNNKLSNYH